MVTWRQLGIHAKPIGLLNPDGFWDRLLDFVRHQHEDGFVRPQHVEMIRVEADADALVRRLQDDTSV
jgi:hypothetical protein